MTLIPSLFSLLLLFIPPPHPPPNQPQNLDGQVERETAGHPHEHSPSQEPWLREASHDDEIIILVCRGNVALCLIQNLAGDGGVGAEGDDPEDNEDSGKEVEELGGGVSGGLGGGRT